MSEDPTPGTELAREALKAIAIKDLPEFRWMPQWLKVLVLFKDPLKMIECLASAVLEEARMREALLEEKVQRRHGLHQATRA